MKYKLMKTIKLTSFILGIGFTSCAKEEDIPIKEEIQQPKSVIELLEDKHKNSITVNNLVYFTEDTNLYDNIDSMLDIKVSKYTPAKQILIIDDWSVIMIDNKLYYIENKYLKNQDKYYNEYSKYKDHVDINEEVAFIEDTTLYSDIDGSVKFNIEIYQKAFELFRYNDWSLIEFNDKLYYTPSSNLENLGSDYVEVDIDEQKVKMFKDNNLILDTDCVTGKATRLGLFTVSKIYGQRYLSGYNGDGSRYHVPVDTFIVFDGNIGFHNVPYRTKPEDFAKDLYLTNKGTHGCINMYKDDALYMKDNIYEGYKVLVHN